MPNADSDMMNPCVRYVGVLRARGLSHPESVQGFDQRPAVGGLVWQMAIPEARKSAD